MPDQATPRLPRVALVFGEAAGAAHVREAISGHADIVYAASAGDFDAPRMLGAQPTAALVNLDDGDWLEGIELKLNEAGVTVVFNDPHVSAGLEGWERARWVRHLVAKLGGGGNSDPPRPATVEAAAEPVASVDDGGARPPDGATEPADGVVAERPLSPEEIETMTVAFVAEPEPGSRSDDEAVVAAPPPADAGTDGPPADDAAVEWDAPASATPEPQTQAPESTVVATEPGYDFTLMDAQDAGFDPDGAPDVDTETLSAMIDARLAEKGPQEPSDSTSVWRVAPEGNVPPATTEQLADADAPLPDPAADAKAPAAPPASPPDDADVLASLPSLEDWQLVDPDLPVEPVATGESRQPEPELPDSVAGLELEPIETIMPVRTRVEPVERWLHADRSDNLKKPQPGVDGGRA